MIFITQFYIPNPEFIPRGVYRKHKTDDPTFPILLLALVFSFIRNILFCLETHARKFNMTAGSGVLLYL